MDNSARNHDRNLEEARFVASYAQILRNGYSSEDRQQLLSELIASSPYIKHLSEVICSIHHIPEYVWDVISLTWEKVRRGKFPDVNADSIASYVFVALRNNAFSILRSEQLGLSRVDNISEEQLLDITDTSNGGDFHSHGITFRMSDGRLNTISYEDFGAAIKELEGEDLVDGTCIRLRLVDVTIKEIARILGVEFNRAHYLCDRAKGRLRKILERASQD